MHIANHKIFSFLGYHIYNRSHLHKKILEYKQGSFRIIYYHMITENKNDIYLWERGITPKIFKEQIKWFKQNYKIIQLKDSIEMIKNGESLNKCLAITTDDGFKENYEYIGNILAEENIKFTMFLTWKSINNKEIIWCDRLMRIMNLIAPSKINEKCGLLAKKYRLETKKKSESIMNWALRSFDMEHKELYTRELWEAMFPEVEEEYLLNKQPYLSINQINELLYDGHDIGSHSLSHPLFTNMNCEQVCHEIDESCKLLSKQFNRNISLFAYPFGRRPEKVCENKYLLKSKMKIEALLGTKNKLGNYYNPLSWERDKLENEINLSMFYFTLMPLIRRYLFL